MEVKVQIKTKTESIFRQVDEDSGHLVDASNKTGQFIRNQFQDVTPKLNQVHTRYDAIEETVREEVARVEATTKANNAKVTTAEKDWKEGVELTKDKRQEFGEKLLSAEKIIQEETLSTQLLMEQVDKQLGQILLEVKKKETSYEEAAEEADKRIQALLHVAAEEVNDIWEEKQQVEKKIDRMDKILHDIMRQELQQEEAGGIMRLNHLDDLDDRVVCCRPKMEIDDFSSHSATNSHKETRDSYQTSTRGCLDHDQEVVESRIEAIKENIAEAKREKVRVFQTLADQIDKELGEAEKHQLNSLFTEIEAFTTNAWDGLDTINQILGVFADTLEEFKTKMKEAVEKKAKRRQEMRKEVREGIEELESDGDQLQLVMREAKEDLSQKSAKIRKKAEESQNQIAEILNLIEDREEDLQKQSKNISNLIEGFIKIDTVILDVADVER